MQRNEEWFRIFGQYSTNVFREWKWMLWSRQVHSLTWNNIFPQTHTTQMSSMSTSIKFVTKRFLYKILQKSKTEIPQSYWLLQLKSIGLYSQYWICACVCVCVCTHMHLCACYKNYSYFPNKHHIIISYMFLIITSEHISL